MSDRRAFVAGMLAMAALAALGSCATTPRAPTGYIVLSVPTNLRTACDTGPALPTPPPTPRSADAVGTYANQLIDTVNAQTKAARACSSKHQRLLRWVDANSVLPGAVPVREVRK
jgi:hypothetical protein